MRLEAVASAKVLQIDNNEKNIYADSQDLKFYTDT